jgi:hypothetical protein
MSEYAVSMSLRSVMGRVNVLEFVSLAGDDIRRLTELRMIRNTQGPLVAR